ncbi:MAG TPA: vWA domain-containing protein [Pyrinomonadaceae bacterium]|nr:vWA domain-containing protein [Pyrinomonadaceae bacterium]
MKSCFQRLSLVFLVIFVFASFSLAQKRPVKPVKKVPQEQTEAKPAADNRAALEMVFVLDTTGSMGGLIEGAKQKIWGIVNEVMQKESRPRVRVGLVAYRDIGDEYVTKILPITEDLDKVYTTLMGYKADGGGDEPENVRRALAEGVKQAGWSQPKTGLAQILFLVGDAPPQNYKQEPDVLITTAEAVRKNMIVNTIQCGGINGTREIWQQIARRGEGKYFAIAQDGGVLAVSTPYDKKLAELAEKIGKTYITYGNAAAQRVNAARQVSNEVTITSGATVSAQAERAVNKAVNSFQYEGDLLQDIENDAVKLKDVKKEDLPEELKNLSPEDRKKEVEKRLAERAEIRKEIMELSRQRDAFVAAERKKLGEQSGFDAAVTQALSEQLLKKGIK